MLHGRRLSHRRLPFLVGPIDTNLARAEPLAVHLRDCAKSTLLSAVRNEAIATSAASLHVPHDARLRDIAEGLKGLKKGFVGDFVGEVADEDVEVAGRVLLVRRVGLVCPIDTDLAVVDLASVHDEHRVLCGGGVVELNEAVVEALGVDVLVRDELDAENGALVEGGEDLGELVFSAVARQAADIKRAVAALDLWATAQVHATGRDRGRHLAAICGARHGVRRRYGGRDGVGVWRDGERRRNWRELAASGLRVAFDTRRQGAWSGRLHVDCLGRGHGDGRCGISHIVRFS